jgi:MoaA/NifB/PqqE/SkfB family radical SAM enzyme
MSQTEKTEGRSYTSNHVKLLKHLDKLQTIQEGMAGEFRVPSPVMFHMSPCNPCNLTCTFCCFANRAMKEMLTLEQMKKAIDSFAKLGVTGMELTGGGEPTLHPDFDEVVEYALSRSLSPTMVSEYETQLPDKKILKQKQKLVMIPPFLALTMLKDLK